MAVDIANWAGYIKRQDVEAWQAEGISKVIIRASTETFPHILVARHQIEVCDSTGIEIEAYIWLYPTADAAAEMARALDTYGAYPIGRWWLDCEEQGDLSSEQMVSHVEQALGALPKGQRGIYTNRSFWLRATGNSTKFAKEPLWDASWGEAARLDGFTSYGGWQKRHMLQHIGDTVLCGVGVDLNVY